MINLETHIRPELWGAISNSYLAEDYTNSIKDAMGYLTEFLREKSGEDGDGYQLVGKVLNFNDSKRPKLQINKLQTETEINMQRGLQDTLRGMYRLIRNPRSHERVNDTQEDADSIILFVNYLLDFLGESTFSFTIDEFVDDVLDEYFVVKDEYASGLVANIPVRKINDSLIALFRAKTWSKSDNVELVIRSILRRVIENDNILDNFYYVVSEELKNTNKGTDVSLVLKVLPSDIWPKLDILARMRAENILLKGLKGNWYNSNTNKTADSASTWLRGMAPYFELKEDMRLVIMDKINQDDYDYQNIVAKYFMLDLPIIFPEFTPQVRSLIMCISSSIIRGNAFMMNHLVALYDDFPQEWRDEFESRLKPLHDKEIDSTFSENTNINLGLFEEKPNPVEQEASKEEDDIPF